MEGDKQVKAEEPSEKKSLLDILNDFCVFYMQIGVSYDEFWSCDTERLPLYYRAFTEKQEIEFERRNYELYLQGLYNYRAFSAAVNFKMWCEGGGKGAQPSGYLEAPIPHTKHEKEMEEQRKIEYTKKYYEKGQK